MIIKVQAFLKMTMVAAAWCWAGGLFAQQGIELSVDTHILNKNDKVIELYIKAMEGGKSDRLKVEEVSFIEIFEGKDTVTLDIDGIELREKERDAASLSDQEQFTVLFLAVLDREGVPSFKEQRDQLIESFSSNIELPNSTSYFVLAYGDVAGVQPKSSSRKTLKQDIASYLERNTYAEFYKTLVEATRFMRTREGRRIIVLLTDGVDLPNMADYDERFEMPYDTADIRYFLSSLDDNFMVFPMGIGQKIDEDFLRLVTESTPSTLDTYSTGNEVPPGLKDLIFAKKEIQYNNIVRLDPNQFHPTYKGEKRKIQVSWHGQTADYDMSGIGSDLVPITLDKDYSDVGNWWGYFFLGLAIVLLVLAVMVWGVPWSRQQAFKKRFIVPYKEHGGVRKRDPLSGELLQEGEMVVVKCPHVTSTLATWEFVGNQCPHFDRCLNFATPCEGHGAPATHDKFSSMKGIFRRLNWFWYGMAGGLVAWSLLALMHLFAYNWYYSMVQGFLQRGQEAVQIAIGRAAANLAGELLMGVALGAGICFALSFVEEKSQPRQFSWLRVLVRTGVGTVASLLVFLLGFYIQSSGLVTNHLLAGLLTWALFGVAVGAVMSVESSITLSRGVLGGVAASLLAGLVYLLLLGKVFTDNFPLSMLVSLLSLGAILGIVLVTVVASMEDFELEYLSPDAFRQTNPISKWLKKSIDVFIGTEQGSYVYVKWTDDQVKPKHARLHFEKGVVFIQPFAETLLNGRMLPLKTSTPLQDGDVFQLGRDSITRMRFREKRKMQAPPPPTDKGQVEQKGGEDKGVKIKFKGN